MRAVSLSFRRHLGEPSAVSVLWYRGKDARSSRGEEAWSHTVAQSQCEGDMQGQCLRWMQWIEGLKWLWKVEVTVNNEEQ